MDDDRAGGGSVERRGVTPIVEKTHVMRAGRLQRCNSYERKIEAPCRPTCGFRDNGERMWAASAKETGGAARCVDHMLLPYRRIIPSRPARDLRCRHNSHATRNRAAIQNAVC